MLVQCGFGLITGDIRVRILISLVVPEPTSIPEVRIAIVIIRLFMFERVAWTIFPPAVASLELFPVEESQSRKRLSLRFDRSHQRRQPSENTIGRIRCLLIRVLRCSACLISWRHGCHPASVEFLGFSSPTRVFLKYCFAAWW